MFFQEAGSDDAPVAPDLPGFGFTDTPDRTQFT
jgi:hypothetical protein